MRTQGSDSKSIENSPENRVMWATLIRSEEGENISCFASVLLYRSFEESREKFDILQCILQFQGGACYDCFVINTSPISLGRLQASFTCRDNDKMEWTVAILNLFQLSMSCI